MDHSCALILVIEQVDKKRDERLKILNNLYRYFLIDVENGTVKFYQLTWFWTGRQFLRSLNVSHKTINFSFCEERGTSVLKTSLRLFNPQYSRRTSKFSWTWLTLFMVFQTYNELTKNDSKFIYIYTLINMNKLIKILGAFQSSQRIWNFWKQKLFDGRLRLI